MGVLTMIVNARNWKMREKFGQNIYHGWDETWDLCKKTIFNNAFVANLVALIKMDIRMPNLIGAFNGPLCANLIKLNQLDRTHPRSRDNKCQWNEKKLQIWERCQWFNLRRHPPALPPNRPPTGHSSDDYSEAFGAARWKLSRTGNELGWRLVIGRLNRNMVIVRFYHRQNSCRMKLVAN